MLVSQVVTWMPVVRCDSCGTEIPTRDAIPHVNRDHSVGLKHYELSFFCSKVCEALGEQLNVVERESDFSNN